MQRGHELVRTAGIFDSRLWIFLIICLCAEAIRLQCFTPTRYMKGVATRTHTECDNHYPKLRACTLLIHDILLRADSRKQCSIYLAVWKFLFLAVYQYYAVNYLSERSQLAACNSLMRLPYHLYTWAMCESDRSIFRQSIYKHNMYDNT